MIPLYIFPLSITILVPLCCVVPYLLAVYYNHVVPVLPYISDTGGSLPESSLFSQLLDITAIMISFTVFIRFKQIKLEYLSSNSNNSKDIKRIELYNKCCHYFGHLISFGLLIIGNYRMTEIIAGHGIGVMIAFSSAILYLALMGYLSLKTATNEDSLNIAKFRLFIAIVATVNCGLTVFFGILSYIPSRKFFDNDFRLNWTKADGGYVWHCLSSLCEWFTVLSVVPYFATFVPQFKNIKWKYLQESHSRKLNETNTTDTNANQVV